MFEREGAQDAVGDDEGDQHYVREDTREELPGHAQGGRTLAAAPVWQLVRHGGH